MGWFLALLAALGRQEITVTIGDREERMTLAGFTVHQMINLAGALTSAGADLIHTRLGDRSEIIGFEPYRSTHPKVVVHG